MWTQTILQHALKEMGWKLRAIWRSTEFENSDLKTFVEENRMDFLSYSDPDMKYVAELENIKGVHVVRDPRDVIVSSYFSHRYSHGLTGWEELLPHREALQKLSFEEGLMLEMRECRREQMEQFYNWDYEQKNILEIKKEDLTRNPYISFARIFDHFSLLEKDSRLGGRFKYLLLQIYNKLVYSTGKKRYSLSTYPSPLNIKTRKIHVERLFSIIFEHEFSKKTQGRKKGEEDISSHYRKGVHGDWKNHFNEEHIAYFKEHYNDVLVKLGYEKDDNW